MTGKNSAEENNDGKHIRKILRKAQGRLHFRQTGKNHPFLTETTGNFHLPSEGHPIFQDSTGFSRIFNFFFPFSM